MKKYPYIGKYFTSKVLFTSERSGICLASSKVICLASSKVDVGSSSSEWLEAYFHDITHEYLSNTKIKIESPEHSRFVQQLAFNCGFDWCGVSERAYTEKPFLYFSDSKITFGIIASSFIESDKKEIKIPLPETKNQKGTPQMAAKPIYTEEMKKNGELPPVGYWFEGHIVELNKPDSNECIVTSYRDGAYSFVSLKSIPTTKTPEEVKAENLTSKLDEFCKAEIDIWKLEILSKAIIKGEISGLTYKGE